MKEIKVISTERAPKAVGPYSQAVSWGDLLFCSGQIPFDPETGVMVEGDIGAQTERVMENLKAVLAAGGASLESVLKVTIYLADMSDFEKVNGVYGRYFEKSPPARACVEVSALPKGARVEADAIAAIK